MTPRLPASARMLLLTLALVAGCRHDAPERVRCAQCGMYVDLAPRWIAGAVDGSGEEVRFDCPKCLLRWRRSDRGAGARDAWVTEYYTQEHRPLEGIVFVVGSDLTSPMGNDLVPVGDDETASRFVADHGGHAVAPEGVDDGLLRELDTR